MSENNELQIVVNDSGLEKNKVQALLENFTGYFNEAKAITDKVKGISVTKEDQKKEMQEARKGRLELREVRIKVENTRKELKEQSLREGKAIDGIANVIKALIVPVEEYLEKQEKFAEELEKARREKIIAEREAELSKYVSDISVYTLGEMSKETYEKLLENSKVAFEAQKDAEKKAEEERIAKEKEEAEAKKKMEEENARLKKEAEEKELALEKERKEKEELEAKIKADEDERKKKKEEEAEKKMKILRAPDKEKLMVLAKTIEDLELPSVISPDARQTVEDIKGMQQRFAAFIRGRASKL